jgi:hypothetical protein
MVAALTIAVGVLALLTFILFGVVVELYRDVQQLREIGGILDRPLDVELGNVAGQPPSAFGLPRALDDAGVALVLFLSDRCGTCHALAAGLRGALSPGLWVVLEARSPDSASEFLAKYGLDAASTAGRLRVDIAGMIAERMGLRTTPVGFRVEDGRLARATTVPSSRYLSSILPAPVRLERSVSPPVKERVPV